MRVQRRLDFRFPRLHGGQELHHAAEVVAFGKSLASHQPTFLQNAIGVEEPVCRHELGPWMIRPPGEEDAEHAREGALADRYAARQRDNIRRATRWAA